MTFHEQTSTDFAPTPSEYEIERHKPMPSLNHAIVQGNLITALNLHYRQQYSVASELSLDLANWPSVPDISLFPKRPLDFKNDQIKVQEPPLAVVEIISPTQSLTELTDKASAYFAHGVGSCWLVLLPLTSICVFSSPDEYVLYRPGDTLLDEVLGIELPLKGIFE